MLLIDDERVETAESAIDTGDDALVRAIDATVAQYNRTIRHAVDAVEGTTRLSMPQWRCLQAMGARPDGSLTSQLARTLKVAVPTMTSMIDGLVERGLVERQPHPTDRRQVRLLLTDDGQHTLERYHHITHDRLAAPLTHLSKARKARLAAALEDLNALLEDEPPRDARDPRSGNA